MTLAGSCIMASCIKIDYLFPRRVIICWTNVWSLRLLILKILLLSSLTWWAGAISCLIAKVHFPFSSIVLCEKWFEQSGSGCRSWIRIKKIQSLLLKVMICSGTPYCSLSSRASARFLVTSCFGWRLLHWSSCQSVGGCTEGCGLGWSARVL